MYKNNEMIQMIQNDHFSLPFILLFSLILLLKDLLTYLFYSFIYLIKRQRTRGHSQLEHFKNNNPPN